MKQRSIFAITTLILLALREKPLVKTKLMHDLTLGYGRVNWYCDLLEREGLIRYDAADRCFSITSRGREVLQLSEELAGFIAPVDNLIKKYSYFIQNQYGESDIPQIDLLSKVVDEESQPSAPPITKNLIS